MKQQIIRVICLFISLSVLSGTAWPQELAIHSMGNGKMCVYGQGPDIITVYPSPYSTPSLFRLMYATEQPVECQSNRESGTAIWTHLLSLDGEEVAVIRDFVDAGLPVLVRHIRVNREAEGGDDASSWFG